MSKRPARKKAVRAPAAPKLVDFLGLEGRLDELRYQAVMIRLAVLSLYEAPCTDGCNGII